MECIFCKIINKEIPAKIHFENEYLMIFEDIEPVAPVHLLVIPKKHIENVDKMTDDEAIYVSEIFKACRDTAKKLDLEKGYRIITNIGEDGLQSVYHMHFHLIGGRKLKWEI